MEADWRGGVGETRLQIKKTVEVIWRLTDVEVIGLQIKKTV